MGSHTQSNFVRYQLLEDKITPLTLTASSLVNAAGIGKKSTLESLQNGTTALRDISFPGLDFKTWLGLVDGLENIELETSLLRFNCRNNKLAKLALDTDGFRNAVNVAIGKYGSNRIGIFMGTSTSGKAETEKAYMLRDIDSGELPLDFNMLHTHNIASVQDYVQHSLALDGVGLTISTACSSSAKVFATAYRYINAGFCDAAIVGGVDTLCLSTLYGFNSLQLISSEPCRPWDTNRDGINIGEAAGFVLLEKSHKYSDGVKLKGYGESSDAYHISSPHPEGDGAKIAMDDALTRSGLQVSDIDYINLHGTGTPSNDAAEARAISRTFPNGIKCSSTKGITGHTLGAAGIVEAIICSLILKNEIVPGNANLKNIDPKLEVLVLEQTLKCSVKNVMSNSLGFGGSNCSLVFGW